MYLVWINLGKSVCKVKISYFGKGKSIHHSSQEEARTQHDVVSSTNILPIRCPVYVYYWQHHRFYFTFQWSRKIIYC